MDRPPATVDLFGLRFDRVDMVGAVAQVMAAAQARRPCLVVTPNIDQIVKFGADPFMHQVYRSALHIYADGMPLVWISRLLGHQRLPARVTGADLLPAVCCQAAQAGLSVYFCGGEPGVAEAAAHSMRARFDGLVVAGVNSPPHGFEFDEHQSALLVDDINRSGARILFLGVGAPKQEKWAFQHLSRLNVGPILCVGAAFSFAAGLVRRAPRWVRDCGMEWAWRLGREPRRLWRRYLVDDMKIFALTWREFQQVKRGLPSADHTLPPH